MERLSLPKKRQSKNKREKRVVKKELKARAPPRRRRNATRSLRLLVLLTPSLTLKPKTTLS
jgi:hypothetical protein